MKLKLKMSMKIVIKEFVGLKPKINSFLVDSSEHKKKKKKT